MIEKNQNYTKEQIIAQLEEAGGTILSMPSTGYSTRLRQSKLDVIHTATEAYGWETPRINVLPPTATAIDRMEQAFAWIQLIPQQKYVLRRIVGARSLVHPITQRYLFPWRKLACMLGVDHKSIQRWHSQGIDLIHLNINSNKNSNI